MLLYRHHSGPLPPPEQLASYDKVLPGLAERIVHRDERILTMAEKQAEHRQKLESFVITRNARSAAVGQALAFIIAIVFGSFAFVLGSNGHELSASVLGGAELVSLVTVFILGRRKQSQENASKRKEQNQAIVKSKPESA
jgi:uncharacterized membrane protein